VDRGQIAEAEPFRAEVEIMLPVLDHASGVPLQSALERCAHIHNPESLPTLCGDHLAPTRQSLRQTPCARRNSDYAGAVFLVQTAPSARRVDDLSLIVTEVTAARQAI
jgi:hypothetical protein